MDKRPLKVFLCHASADKPKVRELYRTLKRRGVQPWLDAEDLIPGQNWEVEIPKALLSSDAIIICLTPNSVDKEGYVQKEIKFALDKAMEMPEGRIFIIPARLEECDLPFSLSKYQAVNLFEKAGYAKLMRALKLRASQLERSTVQLPKAGETTAEIKKVVEEKKPPEPKEEKSEIKTPKPSQDKVGVGGDIKDSVIVSGSGNVINFGEQKKIEPEKPQPKKTKSPRKPNTAIIVALIGLAGTIIAALLASPLIEKWLAPAVTATDDLLSVTPFSTERLASTVVPSIPTISNVVLPTETPSIVEYQIGYLQDTQDTGEYYDDLIVDNLAGDATKTASGFTGQTNYAVSENGQYIARNGDGIIYYVNNMTGEESPLIDSVYQRSYDNLTWSKSGKYIFTTVNGSYTTGNWWQGYADNYWTKYYIISTSDSALTEVADRSGSHRINNVRWSPDDKFVSYWESGNIFTFDPETRHINNITKSGLVSETPYAWSPDANQLLFTLTNENSIYLLDLDTGVTVSLVDEMDGIPRAINWDPEGRKILYSFYYNSNQIYVFDVATKENIFLVEGESPVWSPDGTRLLYLNNGDVFVANADGTNQINITNSPAVTESNPFWLNPSASFAIQTDKIVSEDFGSNYTFCTWGEEFSGEWQETQCYCSGNYCTCTEIHYASRTNRTEMHRFSSRTREKSEVDKNVRDYSGSCK